MLEQQSHLMLKVFTRCFRFSLPIATLLSLSLSNPLATQAQTPPVETLPESQSEDLSDPNNLRPLTQADSLLSLQGVQRVMAEANEAIGSENYALAATKLQQARTIYNQLSTFHLQLANSFSGIDPKIYDAQRNNALKTGQMRDEATYQLALVHRAQNQPELAVPLLIQIIRSQNPTTDLGKKSYQQLYELGFVDLPYATSPPTATSPDAAPTPPAQ